MFMTRMPAQQNAGLDAIAAMIDDDDEAVNEAAPSAELHAPERPVPVRKATKRGLGAMQVAMALSGLEAVGARDDEAEAGHAAKRSRMRDG